MNDSGVSTLIRVRIRMWPGTLRFVLHDGVQAALHARRAVVALESTIITHGLPRPLNYEMAVAAEDQIRRVGAEPATIAILDGRVHIGLDKTQLARVADSDPSNTTKVGRGSLAHALSQGMGWVGGTTVSGTMALAHRAGIRIFATGGIGGVHRGAESSMDISADLTELGRTRVAVFCSGAKSILDIPRTLEYLETQGVPVFTFHASGEFPNFYTASSGCKVPVVSSVDHAARIVAANEQLGLENGIVFGVPIPREFEANGQEIQLAVEQAVLESKELGIDRLGKQVTPWLLQRVSSLAAHSVQNNIALVLNNARHAAECAMSLAGPRKSTVAQVHAPKKARIMVIGCAAVDITAQALKPSLSDPSTAPGSIDMTVGGVAHNIARAAHAMLEDKRAVVLVAPKADDILGRLMQDDMRVSRMRTDALIQSARTPTCNLVLDANGELVTGIADMRVLDEIMVPEVVAMRLQQHQPNFIALDANLQPASLAAALAYATKERVPVLYEPTSTAKCHRILDAMQMLQRAQKIQMVTPNQYELASMAERLRTTFPREPTNHVDAVIRATRLPPALIQDAFMMTHVAQIQLIKLGGLGVLLVMQGQGAQHHFVHVPALPMDHGKPFVNSTGAGDSFTGAILARMSTMSTSFDQITLEDMVDLVNIGQSAAQRTLTCKEAVARSMGA